MATYQSSMPASRAFAPASVPILPGPPAPAGTFLPGTKVQVGGHRVVIDKYLSEGGFAHVYVVSLPKPVDGKQKAVLKRVVVPDKELLASMRNEVETMKRLRGHKYIVKYIDSHASSLKNGGYEVFLLMEWCNGGGLIDFMNTRLQNRLTEPEIIKIFTDVAEGVACMHYLKPALLHRDLKVENVLISADGKMKTFKLCDFGSAAPARPAATSAAEGRLIESDVQRHTTLQYRSPEMIDVYRKQPIDEKSDIWALGCFLYKLCYYTTPFEEVGQMAILNASFKYPGYPRFSDELKLLIAGMLQEQPSRRPNIYQVLAKTTKMDGRPLSMKDIYTSRSRSEDARVSVARPPKPQTQPGVTLVPPKQEATLAIPDVEPMRRGRPTKPTSHHNSAKPSPSPLRMLEHTDAFAALDGGTSAGESADELSSRFPRLDEFSLMSDKGSNFTFQPEPQTDSPNIDPDLAKRVTEALADDAFARPASPPKSGVMPSIQVEQTRPTTVSQHNASKEAKSLRAQSAGLASHTTTSTAVSSSPPLLPKKPSSAKPVWRVPEKADPVERSASITQASSKTRPIIAKDKGGSRLANLLRYDADRSQSVHERDPVSVTSSRPSLEGGRPMLRDLDSGLQRSKSLTQRHRPVSVNVGAHPTHINDTAIMRSNEMKSPDPIPDLPILEHAISDTSNTNIMSDLDFLRAREEEDRERHKHLKRLSGSSHHKKRTSLPSVALSGTKNLLQGRFGEAFRKFESHSDTNSQDNDVPYSPTHEQHRTLTPIAGSEATDLSDDRRGMDETEELSPELRRELEKQKLEAEERRVERAAAEYRQRMGTRGTGPPPVSAKAVSIQNRVQSLLKENDRAAVKTASGYGRFTTDALSAEPNLSSMNPSSASGRGSTHPEMRPISAPASSINLQAQNRMQRPMAPPKPKTLRTGMNDAALPPQGREDTIQDDWEDNFSKKYPDLSHLEVVEAVIDKPRSQLRMREV